LNVRIRVIAICINGALALALTGCSSPAPFGATPHDAATALRRSAPQPTPGRTFLVLTWRAKFAHGLQSGAIDFPARGRQARVYIKETLARRPFGEPYRARIEGTCATIVSQVPNHSVKIYASTPGRCRIIVRDSLKPPNVKNVPLLVP
jgi:hypothetical protein